MNIRFLIFLRINNMSWKDYNNLDNKCKINAEYICWISEMKNKYGKEYIINHVDFTNFIINYVNLNNGGLNV